MYLDQNLRIIYAGGLNVAERLDGKCGYPVGAYRLIALKMEHKPTSDVMPPVLANFFANHRVNLSTHPLQVWTPRASS